MKLAWGLWISVHFLIFIVLMLLNLMKCLCLWETHAIVFGGDASGQQFILTWFR